MEKFLERRNKIRRCVARQKMDALLITNPINIRYLTGFTGSAGRLLIRTEGDTILSDPRYTIQIGEQCPGLEAVIRPRTESPSKTLAKLLGRKTSGKLGVEAESLTVAQHERLFEALSLWQSVPTKNVVEELRQIKDKDEIAQIRYAIKIAGEAFKFLSHLVASNEPFVEYKDIKPVKQWRENGVSILLDSVMRFFGAGDRSFPTIIAAGARSALPHAVPADQIVGEHSHLLFDWGCVVNGYMCDLTRVLIFNPNNKKLRYVYETVLKAQTAAIAAIKPGKTCEEIDAVARNIIKDAGFGKHFGHGLGHSIGLEVHENPRFAPGDKTVLKPGMVLTIEPGIYLKGWGGVRIEDDILVTKSGCEVLSRNVPKTFEEMSLSWK